MWVFAAFSPCGSSSIFTFLLCLWLCIQTPSRWGLLSAFHCSPHWFGLVCERRRPPPGSAQSQSLFRLQAVGLKWFRCPLWLFSKPKETKTVWQNKITLFFFHCMQSNCHYLPECIWPSGKTFTSTAGGKMVKTAELWCEVTHLMFLDKTNYDKNNAHFSLHCTRI